ncbi:MAG TPA: DUF4158 domain-containing protein, partial [Isosphaeraceae bacterium]|nr:DUF4158 domain-containing protein [Isosphaeraceae bacterium]
NLPARTVERHRAEIRAMLGYREATVADAEALEDWLRGQAAEVGAVADHLTARLEARCREMLIEPPSTDRVDRIVRKAIHAYEERLYADIHARLPFATRARLDALLKWVKLSASSVQPMSKSVDCERIMDLVGVGQGFKRALSLRYILGWSQPSA